MSSCIEVAPTPHPRRVLGPRGEPIDVPADWVLLPPGDAALTRRVKLAGPSLQVIEPRGRKKFSRGLWAPAVHVEAAQQALLVERADPRYAERLEAGRARRAREEARYEVDFANAVIDVLAFSPRWRSLAQVLAVRVTAHATPVGSGTVARTERIPLPERAEAALIAWLRHQTTAYDDLDIPRVKGLRREVRRTLAERSRQVLARHREDTGHAVADCPLCRALAQPAPPRT